jgi:hypothetical protein
MTYNRNDHQSAPRERKTRISKGLRQGDWRGTGFAKSPAGELSLYRPAAAVQNQFGERRLA